MANKSSATPPTPPAIIAITRVDSPCGLTIRWAGVEVTTPVCVSLVCALTWYSPSGGVQVYEYFPCESVVRVVMFTQLVLPAMRYCRSTLTPCAGPEMSVRVTVPEMVMVDPAVIWSLVTVMSIVAV